MSKTLYTHQSENIWKTWLLMACFLAVFIGIGFFTSQYYGNPSILTIFIIVSVLMNVFSYWYSDKIVLKLSHAREVKREEFMDLWNITENLAIRTGLPMPRLYVIDDPALNAFATGRNKKRGVIAVTTGLLSVLDKAELEGVIAHELAHIGNRDILLMSMVAVLVGCIALIGDFFLRSMIWGGGPGSNRNNGNGGGNQIFLIIGIIFIILSPIIATIIQLAISRKREFLADATAALMTRYPEGLVGALDKISKRSQPLKHAHTATAHMFISNPFSGSGGKINFIAKMFSTHPPIEERIKALLG